jgi:RecQ family ATP-dependent DNA helicase
LKSLLKRYFGYDSFRPLQEEIINNVMGGSDSFVLMPTGGGKSLCYQLPALMMDGITLVVSPLIALMKDQVDSLQACGVRAEFINSSIPAARISDICARAKNDDVKILYIAPERFALKSFQDFLKSLKVALIAVDEAHCISEWGHDFRPDYRNLSLLKELFPDAPVIALTATATEKVREDILSHLFPEKPRTFISSFNRENLKISVIEKKQAFAKLLSLLSRHKNEPAIIYCFSRNETEELAEKLKLNGYSAGAYHAGMEAEKRKQVQDLFIRDKVDIIVATIAFGMGIDKPDVRLVAHYTYPKTLEGYYQEIGRAGRDGLPSECVLFYTYADTRKHEYFIDKMEDDILRERARVKLAEVSRFFKLTTCRKKHLLAYFGERLEGGNCGGCDNCLGEKETLDAKPASKDKPKRGSLDYNAELFEELRAIRKELANKASVPPFVIFGDTSLQEMACYLPRDKEGFSGISGVGARKLEQYGDVFLEAINKFALENNIPGGDIPARKREVARPKPVTPGKSAAWFKTRELLLTMTPLDKMAEIQGIKPGTVAGHIEDIIQAGEKIDLDYLKIPGDRYAVMKAAFEECGAERLKPAFEYLGEEYSYDELRLARVLMNS